MNTPKKTILAIDDEADLTEMIQFQFEAKGYQVFTASNGQEGLAQLQNISPDLIILDLNMPVMGGIEFFQEICKGTEKVPYPVLVLTARANTEHLFEELDVAGFIAKPFEIDDLIKKAEGIIQENSHRSSSEIAIGGEEQKVRIHKIHLVEDNPEHYKKISTMLVEAGFSITLSKSGTSALERIVADAPDLVLIKLGLHDIAGDLTVLKLNQMANTTDIKSILYTHHEEKHIPTVMSQMQEKSGLIKFMEYGNPQELIEAVDEVL